MSPSRCWRLLAGVLLAAAAADAAACGGTPLERCNEAWLRLCAWYDAPYHVVTPDQARGAGNRQEP